MTRKGVIQKITFLSLSVLYTLFWSGSVIGAPPTPTPTPNINPTTFPVARFSNIGVLFNILSPLLIGGGVVGFLAMGLYGAFTYLTAGGDAEKVSKGHKILTWAILGILLVTSSFVIVQLIGFVTRVDIPI